MSIAAVIPCIALLGNVYGLQIHTEIVSRLPHRAHLNVGQIYSTIDRLVRDDHLTPAGHSDDGLPLYSVSRHGQKEALAWMHGETLTATSTWDEFLDVVLVAAHHPDTDWDKLTNHVMRMNSSAEEFSSVRTTQQVIDSVFRNACMNLFVEVSRRRSQGTIAPTPLSATKPKRGRRSRQVLVAPTQA